MRDQRQQFALVGYEINFVNQQKDRSVGLFCDVESERVFGLPLFPGVDDHQDQVATLERLAHFGHHFPSQRRTVTMNSGRIDQYDLSGFSSLVLGDIDDAKNTVARGLWLGWDACQVFAD